MAQPAQEVPHSHGLITTQCCDPLRPRAATPEGPSCQALQITSVCHFAAFRLVSGEEKGLRLRVSFDFLTVRAVVEAKQDLKRNFSQVRFSLSHYDEWRFKLRWCILTLKIYGPVELTEECSILWSDQRLPARLL